MKDEYGQGKIYAFDTLKLLSVFQPSEKASEENTSDAGTF